MKKRIALALAIIMLLTVAGCKQIGENATPGSTTTQITTAPTTSPITEPTTESNETSSITTEGDDSPDGQLFTLIAQIYEKRNPDLALGDIAVDMTNIDEIKYFTGLNDLSKVKDIAVSEALIGSQAYSLVLVQVSEAADVKAVADAMFSGIDQRKWICVEADDLQVVAQGDLIMLFMVDSELKDTVTTQEMVDAFTAVRGGKLDIILKK